MRCSSCGHQNSADSRFCTVCGNSLEGRCPSCGAAVGGDGQFCTQCGARLAALASPTGVGVTGTADLSDNPFLRLKARSLLLWGLLSIPVLIIAYVAVVVVDGGSFEELDPALDLIVLNGWLYGLIIIWGVWKIARHRVDLGCLVGRVPPDYRWLTTIGLVGLLLLFSLAAIVLVLLPLSLLLPDYVDSLLSQDALLATSETPSPALYNTVQAVSLVVLAPVLEEVLFRGILFTRWSVRWGVGKALIISSLCFAILHVDLVGAFVFGMVMCLLYLRTGTLLVPMACHALNNAFVLGVGILAGLGEQEEVAGTEELGSELWVALVFLAISAPLLLRFIYRGWPQRGARAPYFWNLVPKQA